MCDKGCNDPKQCNSHYNTLKELSDLKKENENFRKELDELKEVISGLHNIEKTIRDIYEHYKHPILNAIIKFFERRKKNGT